MKILILTASPVRDKHIDELISNELKKRGHEVFISPCVRGGRQMAMDVHPDVVVIPPIKNPYARDTAEELKRFGCGLVTRHTEASVSWQDFKSMPPGEKSNILGVFPYSVDAEIVWSSDEADILNRRNTPFKCFAVGAFALDVYFREDFDSLFMDRTTFNSKLGLQDKKTVLFASCWSFADTAPDLQVDEMIQYNGERRARDKWIEMVNYFAKSDEFNLVLKVHPGESDEEYRKVLNPKVVIIKEQSSPETLKNIDFLVHAGSTMAVEANVINKPAFQFCDINEISQTSWYTRESALSRVSPKFESYFDLYEAIRESDLSSNASTEALEELESGRFGKMDGKAYLRAADIIETVIGQFKSKWPRAWRNYDTPEAKKFITQFARNINCGACGEEFAIKSDFKGTGQCPWCGIKVFA